MLSHDGGHGSTPNSAHLNGVMEIADINSIKNNQENQNKTKPRQEYKYKNIKRGNYIQLTLAKEVYNPKLNDVTSINKNWRNRISVIFKSYTTANNFIKKR